MDSASMAFIVCGIVNIPLFILIGKWLFGDWYEFWDAIKFWLTPDVVSLLTGSYWADNKAELKLGVFVLLMIGIVVGELMLVSEFFAPAVAA